MKIEIISTESLGARGMCTMVEVTNRRILIDPGIALGLLRQGLFPHPAQIARGAELRERIIHACTQATDIVFSHYHGDHIPLAKSNPYQLPLARVATYLKNTRLWGMNPHHASPIMQARAEDIETVSGTAIETAEGQCDGEIQFSAPVPHGCYGSEPNMVMMTCIKDNDLVFVHASDIQLIESDPVQWIINCRPDVVFVSGPPLYLHIFSSDTRKAAWDNARALAEMVPTLIIDHHLLRSWEGIQWLAEVQHHSQTRVICAADHQHKKRRFLEADRVHLYQEQPVPEGWHKAYEKNWNKIIQ